MCLNRSSNKHHNLVWRCFRQCQFRTSSYRQTWLVMRLGPFAWLGMHFATLDPWSRAWHLDSLTGFCSCWLAWKGRNQFGNRLTESWAAADAQIPNSDQFARQTNNPNSIFEADPLVHSVKEPVSRKRAQAAHCYLKWEPHSFAILEKDPKIDPLTYASYTTSTSTGAQHLTLKWCILRPLAIQG